MTTTPAFSLWLEFETYADGYPQLGDDPRRDFCNAIATVDGRRYGINIWTFDFVDYARRFDEITGQRRAQPETFMLPPDLLVERLERPVIEHAIATLLLAGPLPAHWHDRGDEEPVA